MGFFSKDKNNNVPAAPPAAPSAPSSIPAAPPSAPAAPPSSAPSMPPVPSSSSGSDDLKAISGGLPTPPMPSANLDDIKSQINSNQDESPSLPAISSQNDLAMPTPSSMPSESPQEPQSNEEDDIDSLFDISDLEIEGSDNNSNSEESTPQVEEESTEDIPTASTSTIPQESSSDSGQFITHHKEIDDNKPFFVTTSQFKALLEIIENVKSKTKEASERHLRLLDIKSEEDIEYENLKKDFTYIEDKLYEVDNLIFEND